MANPSFSNLMGRLSLIMISLQMK